MAIITEDTKLKINQLYYEYKNKAKVGRELGISSSTVSKYIIPNWAPSTQEVKHFTHEMLPPLEIVGDFDISINHWNEIIALTDEEKEEMKILWGELQI